MTVKRKGEKLMLNHALAVRPNYHARLRQTRVLRLVPSPSARPQVLLVCDSALNTAEWRAALCEAEVVSVAEPEDVTRFSSHRFALAVLDVAAANLIDALKTVRTNAEQSDLPILVEAESVTDDLSFAGVLPQYRAMACGQSDLIQLARRRLTGATPPPRKEVML
jgi:hypothetical protein